MRLHAHYSERVLARCGAARGARPARGTHHERLDGSGYHRQLTGGGPWHAARLLAAADAFQAMTQQRAHRPRSTHEYAAALLAAEARAGRLDPDAVRAVFEAAGGAPQRVTRTARRASPSARSRCCDSSPGDSPIPQIAKRLVISRRTAEHHVQDVYARIGVSSRAAAALFAMEHDLLRDG